MTEVAERPYAVWTDNREMFSQEFHEFLAENEILHIHPGPAQSATSGN
jgi:hypothetical protein